MLEVLKGDTYGIWNVYLEDDDAPVGEIVIHCGGLSFEAADPLGVVYYIDFVVDLAKAKQECKKELDDA